MAIEITYPAPVAGVTAAAFEATNTLEKKIAFIRSFNNALYLGRGGDRASLRIRATEFAAKGIARGGFNVTRLHGDVFIIERPRALSVNANA